MKNQTVYYTTADCALGRILVAGTTEGIRAVSLGETDAVLETVLDAYPNRQRNLAHLGPWLVALQDYLAGTRTELALPLDSPGTAFQHRVWQQLQAIPYGNTLTYQQVARAIDQPQAVRAVAGACATNAVSLVIPCHRVVRSDGGLGGYRWGLTRKQALLNQESASLRKTG
ncbi:methylated-DNA--[protein]-cysteine S-methyltransferase [Candidatus Cyanaurora vandensis]|uniref:methylated-DNA--[protein]-cysteine S-methyltransferase n=1 Tax=Candidatus Cyanaurora vandensis TaxID=2714958 RepID=UPI00257C7769|nr:methylated-DNA--[protein]-cysteine S-methyltransferase [Candidatus Cyanaurora vandensis]